MLLSLAQFKSALNISGKVQIFNNPKKDNRLFASATADFNGQLVKVNFAVGPTLCKDEARTTWNEKAATHVHLGDDFDITKMSIEEINGQQYLQTNAPMAICISEGNAPVAEF